MSHFLCNQLWLTAGGGVWGKFQKGEFKQKKFTRQISKWEESFWKLLAFVKTEQVCHINYEPLAYNETVEICRTPIVKVNQKYFSQIENWENIEIRIAIFLGRLSARLFMKLSAPQNKRSITLIFLFLVWNFLGFITFTTITCLDFLGAQYGGKYHFHFHIGTSISPFSYWIGARGGGWHHFHFHIHNSLSHNFR